MEHDVWTAQPQLQFFHPRILNLKLTYATGVSGRTAPAVLWIMGFTE
jgi:hypothetical protein